MNVSVEQPKTDRPMTTIQKIRKDLQEQEETTAVPEIPKGPMIENGQAWIPTPGGPGNSFVPVPVEKLNESIERDVKGFPYDARIHAGSKTKKKDGSWTYRRGVEDSEVTAVEAELKAGYPVTAKAVSIAPMGALPALPAIPQAPAPTVNVPMPALTQAPPPVAPVTPAYNMIPGVPTGQVTGAYDLQSFRDQLPMVMMNLVNTGKITPEYIKQLNDYFKVTELWQVGGDEVKSAQLFEQFAQMKFITKVG